MKIMMFAALAAAVSMPALAQTAPATPDTSMQQPAPAQPAADPAMQQAPAAPAAPAADPAMGAPAGAPAMAPQGGQPPMAAPAAAAPMPATAEYPACSRTVKDQCIDKRSNGGAKKAMHRKRK
ncbi:hypothetical protein [Sphingomonas sp. PAMC 26621]|uniref:hypothetical protein n=1 Tax=Sphingomonas sp. PAMC 26621 TaxID=1112213 RepID=UPI000288DD78|nr:hypothetical protein [Sphingomonas sp. PAMC 26621]